ncbi:MAG: hypothetical protein JO069_20450 [Verrucomicrobia bacterium]|nr:hypothetical protein [Verrucomicrobiota bacterium]
MIRFFFVLLLLILGAFLFQFYLPPVLPLEGAPILLVPSLYFYGAVALPFPLMLALTVYTGLVHDLLTIPQAGSRIEFPAGFSVLVYAVPGLVMHGLRPLFLRYRWLWHFFLAEVSAVLTPVLPAANYVILSFARREFFYSDVIVWRILGPGLMSLVIAPCLFFILTPLAQFLNYRPGLKSVS